MSLFGRGYGKSIVIHLGDKKWMIVDSLLDEDGLPPALKYLASINVDVTTEVVLVVASHWHDDHSAGLGKIYTEARSATLALPATLNDDQMRAFCEQLREAGSERISSGVQELRAIARERSTKCRKAFRLAKANTNLVRFVNSLGYETKVEALSPSDQDAQVFIQRLAELPPLAPGARAEPFEENDISVAIWVSIKNYSILLGGDLENSSDAERGWKAVIASPAAVCGKAAVIKVPHHGSDNAHSEEVWEKLLEENPLACLTTWNRGKKLPKGTDAERILSLTNRAFITSALIRKPKKQLAAVEKTIKESGVILFSRPKASGHIRFRLDMSEDSPVWNYELFGDARALADLEKV